MSRHHSMSNADAAWLHMDRPTNLMVITSVIWTDEPIDVARLTQICQERLVDRFPKFRQRVVESHLPFGGPHWEDDPGFDIALHIHHVALPAPGDRAELERFVGDRMARSLDRSRALWDMHVIDNYGTGSALLVRMHHCIADGIALARVMLSLTDEQPDAGIAPPDGDDAGRAGGGPLGVITGPARTALSAAKAAAGAWGDGVGAVLHPRRALALGATVRDDARSLARQVFLSAEARTPLKGDPGVPRRATWSTPLPLDDVKQLAHATQTTVNDVLLSAMTGALRRYLIDRDGLVDEIRAFVPFNLRPLDEPLPRELGNRFGLVFLALPVGIADASERLAELHRRMDEIKHSPDGAVAYGILSVVGVAPAQVEKLVIDMFTAKGTAVMTNVPGPRETVYLAGTAVRGVLVWAPTSASVSMSVSIFSYDGDVTVGLMVDAGLIPDPEKIIESFGEELDELRAAVNFRPAMGQTRHRAPSQSAHRH
jgi:diacylglycerol O-acyltransferase